MINYISLLIYKIIVCVMSYKFCEDIIESTRNIKLTESLEFIVKRWKR